jgi:hypothetical protein
MKVFTFILFLIGFSACVNLKEVQSFSDRSLIAIKKFEESNYSFATACRDKCFVEQLEKNKLLESSCNCSSEKQSDSATMAIYLAVKGYFSGLDKLSQNELTNYKFNTISTEINKFDIDGLTINASHVNAYAKMANIFSRAVSDGYRRKKISGFIEEANDPVKSLLDALEFNLVSNLSRRLVTQQERLKAFYFDLIDEAGNSGYQKKKIIEEYTEAFNKTESIRKQLISYGKSLHTISIAHQKLYENRNRLKSRPFRELLIGYISDIENLSAEINKIKNTN